MKKQPLFEAVLVMFGICESKGSLHVHTRSRSAPPYAILGGRCTRHILVSALARWMLKELRQPLQVWGRFLACKCKP